MPSLLRHNPANPRYFADADGSAVYLTGSHTWAVMNDMWLEGAPRRHMAYQGYLQMMEDHGHNFLRFWMFQHGYKAPWADTPTIFDPLPYNRSGEGAARDGQPKFDLSDWNDAYFERLRDRVIAAGERGIYVAVMFFEGWTIQQPKSPDTDPWPYHPWNPTNNVNGITDNPVREDGLANGLFSLDFPQILAQQKRFIEKVIETVGDLDNVLYEIANEVPRGAPGSIQWQMHLVDYVREVESGREKQHPVGITAQKPGEDNTELFESNADWISPATGDAFEYRYNPPAADGSKVIISDTDHYWGHGIEITWIWKSLTRGHNPIFMDPWEPVPGGLAWWNAGDYPLNSRFYYLWDDARRAMGYARRIATLLDLNKAIPENDLCTSTYCLAQRGVEYLCYYPQGGSEGVNLHDAPGEFSVEWFETDTGQSQKGDDITGGDGLALTSPFTGPSVLWLRRK